MKIWGDQRKWSHEKYHAGYVKIEVKVGFENPTYDD